MLTRVLTAIALLVGAASVYAAPAAKSDLTIRIRQLDFGQQSLSAEIPPAVKVRKGDYLVARANGTTCNLGVTKVVHIKGTYRNLAIASLKGCQIANLLSRGQRLEKSDFSALARAKARTIPVVKKQVVVVKQIPTQVVLATPPTQTVVPSTVAQVDSASTHTNPAVINGFQVGLYLPYTDNFRDVGVSTVNGVVEGDISTSLTAGVSLRYNQTIPNNLGFSIGISYDFERKFDRALIRDIDGVYVPVQTYNHDEGLSIITPEANATYGFSDTVYGFAGANYSLPILTNAYATDASGDVGMQVGGGLIVGKNFTIEGSYRLNQIKLDYRNAPDTSKAIGKFHAVMLSTSYLFNL